MRTCNWHCAAAFQSKGLTEVGPCPPEYNTLDHSSTVEQCPDGITNVRYVRATHDASSADFSLCKGIVLVAH